MIMKKKTSSLHHTLYLFLTSKSEKAISKAATLLGVDNWQGSTG